MTHGLLGASGLVIRDETGFLSRLLSFYIYLYDALRDGDGPSLVVDLDSNSSRLHGVGTVDD